MKHGQRLLLELLTHQQQPLLEGLAAGQGGHAAPALARVAGRQVEQGLRQLVLLELGRDVGSRCLIGKQDLDRLEAVRRGRTEALQEGHLLVDPRKVGGELGHGGVSSPGAVGAARSPKVTVKITGNHRGMGVAG